MPDLKILRFDTLPSTQDRAVELARNGKESEWVAVTADSQTSGRGTAGKEWYSPAGCNLYFSLIMRPPESMADTAVINHSAALAVAGELSGYGIACRIKWPNDVQAGGKKICGILSSTAFDGLGGRFAVCGIGLNVNAEKFPPGLSGCATSMFIETGRRVDKEKLLSGLLAALRARLLLLFQRGFSGEVREYISLMAQLGDTYVDGAGRAVGKIEGISEKGRLLVRCSNGVEAVCLPTNNAAG